MNYEHDGQLSIFCRASQIAFDRTVSGRRLHDFVAHFNAFVIRRYLLRPGVVGCQALENRRDGQAAGRKLAKTIKESTAVDVAVLVFVKQIQQLLRIIGCFLSFHSSSLDGIGAEYEATLLPRW